MEALVSQTPPQFLPSFRSHLSHLKREHPDLAEQLGLHPQTLYLIETGRLAPDLLTCMRTAQLVHLSLPELTQQVISAPKNTPVPAAPAPVSTPPLPPLRHDFYLEPAPISLPLAPTRDVLRPEPQRPGQEMTPAEEAFFQALGLKIHTLRVGQQLDLWCFAIQVGLTAQETKNLEFGRANPELHTLERVAQVLGLPFVELLQPPSIQPGMPFPVTHQDASNFIWLAQSITTGRCIRGLTSEHLARHIHVSLPQYTSIEKGTTIANILVYLRIAALLSISLHALLRGVTTQDETTKPSTTRPNRNTTRSPSLAEKTYLRALGQRIFHHRQQLDLDPKTVAAHAGLSVRTYLLIESGRSTFKLSAYERVAQRLSIPLHQLLQEAAALSKAPAAGHRHRINESENNPILEFLHLDREPGDEVHILPNLLAEALPEVPDQQPEPRKVSKKQGAVRQESQLKARTDHLFLRLVGHRIRHLRLKQERSAADLAAQIGTTEKRLLRIEAGHINAGMLTFLWLAQALNTPVTRLLSPTPLPFHPRAAHGGDMENHDLPNLTAPTSDEQDHPETPSQRQATPGQTPHPRVDTEPTEETNTQPLPNENHTVPMDALTEHTRGLSPFPLHDSAQDAALLKATGLRIRALRRSRNLSIDALSEQLDLNGLTLIRIEEGQAKLEFTVYQKIASLLNVPMTEIIKPNNDLPSQSELDAKVQRELVQLGMRIQQRRLTQRRPLREFLMLSGLSNKELENVEQGCISLKLTAMQRLAGVLGVTLAELFQQEDSTLT